MYSGTTYLSKCTWFSTYSWKLSTPHSVPVYTSCAYSKPTLIVCTYVPLIIRTVSTDFCVPWSKYGHMYIRMYTVLAYISAILILFSNSCSPQVVISYVTYLCHHLLILRKEIRAAVVLQRAWRAHNSKMTSQQIAVSGQLCKDMFYVLYIRT